MLAAKKVAWASAVFVCALFVADVCAATETVRYIYDARGRVIRVERTGTVNNTVNTNYEYDKVNNRRRVLVTGSPNAPPP